MNASTPRLTPVVMAALTLCAAAALTATAPGAQAAARSDAAAKPSVDRAYALVQLAADPLATSAKTKPAKGKKIDFNNGGVKSHRAFLSAQRNDYKAWLRANVPGARVSGEFDIALNAVAVKLNGATLAQVAAAPMVRSAQYQGLYYPSATDPDLALIDAVPAWNQSGGAATAGEGVKVAIVDSGIDVAHPCFADTGYPVQTKTGPASLTNNKVIVAKVFNNKAKPLGVSPAAVQDHGTHVAGTVACNFETPATVEGGTVPYGVSGVAPRAVLGNYNVFPGPVTSARSEDILNALEAAYADGFQVANMSLGGGSHGIQDLLSTAVDNLDLANMVITVSAGNEGPGLNTVGSPGIAPRGLTAGASSVGHSTVSYTLVNGASYLSVRGEFGHVPAGGLTAPLAVVADATSPFGGLSQACGAPVSAPLPDLSGRIALLSRGTCDFTVKVRNAQAAGAVGVLMVNREAGPPFVMGGNGEPDQPTLPAYMVGLADRAALMAADGASTTLPDVATYVYDPARNNILADFSSRGPTDVDFRVKPDVVAPGDFVLSSIPVSNCGGAPCFAFFSGTSMAAPHLAGSAAIVIQQRPGLSAAEVRSAVVNTANRTILTDFDGSAVTGSEQGAGLENLVAATNAVVALDPVSVSYGAIPSGSGQTRAIDVTVRNTSGGALTLTPAATGGRSGVSFSVPVGAFTLAAGESTTLRVTVRTAQGVPRGEVHGLLTLTGAGEVAHAVLYTLIK
ncbi:MAG TPA: S8 family serine peptidase [Methylibium sp.]|nr:S8 family serine peptidase [Methylibium sp.]